MPYLSRRDQIGYTVFYHLFNRSDSLKTLFHCDEDYQYFMFLLADYSAKSHFDIYHWVLMPDHYHLLVKVERADVVSPFMAGLARAYVYYYHKKYHTYGHLWQGRFKSQALREDKFVLYCGRYVERNPVDSAMADCFVEYPYSSSRYYVFGESDRLTSENPLYRVFGFQLKIRRQRYLTFLNMSDSKADKIFDRLEFPQSLGRVHGYLGSDTGAFLSDWSPTGKTRGHC